MYLVINKWVIAVKVSNFSGQYLHNHWTLDIGVLGYIGIVWPKEHSPEVSHIPPVTPRIQSVLKFKKKFRRQRVNVWYILTSKISQTCHVSTNSRDWDQIPKERFHFISTKTERKCKPNVRKLWQTKSSFPPLFYYVEWTNKCTIKWQIIMLPLHVLTLLRHPQGACS